MSKADKMFEELGFKLNKEPSQNHLLFYVKENLLGEDEPYEYIVFHKDKTIAPVCNDRKYIVALDMKLLQAINEKVKELGWYE